MVLVTGCAGFVGFHVSKKLLERGEIVIGVDNLNSYYSVDLKKRRLSQLTINKNFVFKELDITSMDETEKIFLYDIKKVVHLAAQAGVQYSLKNSKTYLDSNIVGTYNLLECVKNNPVDHFVFASSSSVYGHRHDKMRETDKVDKPISFYAASKLACENMAHAYSHMYDIPISALRYFTVYGPWGRPDMALWIFTDAIINGKPIRLNNNGKMYRNFTYIDDIVSGTLCVLDHPLGYEVYNIGNDKTVPLLRFVEEIEKSVSKKAIISNSGLPVGDVLRTEADILKAVNIGYMPTIDISFGVKRFIQWYKRYGMCFT